jgi:predicted ester cyclase
MGIPPTGRPIQVSGISIHRFAGVQMQESWDSVDNLGLLRQLDAIPTLEQPA